MNTARTHWDTIYSTKQGHEVSWTQDVPRTSLEFLHEAKLDKHAAIIDVGGGDSKFVDFLLSEGYDNISVLDISEQALNRARHRIGTDADRVHWVLCDITEFEPTERFDYWHDRAAFHFLTTQTEISMYLDIARRAVKTAGVVTIGTFSNNGPKKCSGLEIKQYSEQTLSSELQDGFEKIRCITEDHTTPFNTTQNFLFCSFRRIPK
jgi:ubiquinone/menaquinone biosynthesis C-methylase UbiE